MVKDSWSVDKENAEEKRRKAIRAERVRQFNILRRSPAFTTVSILSVFDQITKEATDLVTMKNGDTYKAKRKEVEKIISTAITQKVDEILGLRVTILFRF